MSATSNSDDDVRVDVEQLHWARNVLPSTTFPPIDSEERAEVRATLEDNEKRIQKYEESLAAMRMERERHLAILSHARSIPPEMLARVLSEHLNNTPEIPFANPPRLAPLLVCRDWHRIAINTPSCWAKLGIRIGRGSRTVQHMKLQFMRAQSLLVDLTIHFDGCHESHALQPGVRAQVETFLGEHSLQLRSYAEHGACFSQKMMLSLLSRKTDTTLTRLHLNKLEVREMGNQICKLWSLKYLEIDKLVGKDLYRLFCPSLKCLTLNAGTLGITPDRMSPPEFLVIVSAVFPTLKHLSVPSEMVTSWSQCTKDNKRSIEEIIVHNKNHSPNVMMGELYRFLSSFPSASELVLSSIIIQKDRQRGATYPPIHHIQDLVVEGYVAASTISTALKSFPGLKRARLIHLDGSKPKPLRRRANPANVANLGFPMGQMNQLLHHLGAQNIPAANPAPPAPAPAPAQANQHVHNHHNHAHHQHAHHQFHAAGPLHLEFAPHVPVPVQPHAPVHVAPANGHGHGHVHVGPGAVQGVVNIIANGHHRARTPVNENFDPAMLVTLFKNLRKVETAPEGGDDGTKPVSLKYCPTLEHLELSGYTFTKVDFAEMYTALRYREDLAKPSPAPCSTVNAGDAARPPSLDSTDSLSKACLLSLYGCKFRAEGRLDDLPSFRDLNATKIFQRHGAGSIRSSPTVPRSTTSADSAMPAA